jgi:hypothetical protein
MKKKINAQMKPKTLLTGELLLPREWAVEQSPQLSVLLPALLFSG